MGTALGAVIDYLLEGLDPILRPLAPDLVLADAMPVQTSNSLVVIGRNGPASGMATDAGQIAYAELGLQRVQESFVVHCFVQTYRPGPAQKPARDACIGLYDQIVAFIAADPSFGGVLLRGRVGLVTQLQLEQTADQQDTAGGALRLTAIDFGIHVQNAYVPTS